MRKAILSIFGGNLLGKVIGLLREITLSYFYGTGAILGAFRVSQSTALVTVNFFTTDTLNSGFIPLFKEYDIQSKERSSRLFWSIHTLLLGVSVLIVLVLFFFSNNLISLVAPGLTQVDSEIAVEFLQILALSIPFYVLSALYVNLAIAKDAYLLVSVRPTVQSTGLILGALASYITGEYRYIAWGFFGAFVSFFCFSFVYICMKRYVVLGAVWCNDSVLTFWCIVKPLLPLPFFLQGNIIVEKAVSSMMGVEVIAAVEFAKFITETGMVLLAIPIGYVGLAKMSGLSKAETPQFLTKVSPIVLLLTIPASCFLWVHAEKLVSFLYYRGAFEYESVIITSSILKGLSLGFWAQVLSYIVLKALNSDLHNRLVFKYMLAALIANVVCNIFLYKILGPFAIGLGVSVYGLILLVLSLHHYKLSAFIYSFAMPLVLLSTLYSLMYKFLDVELGVFGVILVFSAYFGGGILLFPRYRETIANHLKVRGKF